MLLKKKNKFVNDNTLPKLQCCFDVGEPFKEEKTADRTRKQETIIISVFILQQYEKMFYRFM